MEKLEQALAKRPVQTVQQLLGELARQEGAAWGPKVDGVFGERTLEAVMRFQKGAGLPVTGSVDARTWRRMQRQWQRREQGRPVRVFPPCAAGPGERCPALEVPQLMLRLLTEKFHGLEEQPVSGQQDAVSAANARWLQRSAGAPETGVLDGPAWDALSRLYELFVLEVGRPRGERFSGGWG